MLSIKFRGQLWETFLSGQSLSAFVSPSISLFLFSTSFQMICSLLSHPSPPCYDLLLVKFKRVSVELKKTSAHILLRNHLRGVHLWRWSFREWNRRELKGKTSNVLGECHQSASNFAFCSAWRVRLCVGDSPLRGLNAFQGCSPFWRYFRVGGERFFQKCKWECLTIVHPIDYGMKIILLLLF